MNGHDAAGAAAGPGHPRVRVHMLSEAVFCQRAALLGEELPPEDDDVPDTPPRWDYVPPIYSEIELARRMQTERALRFVGLVLGVLLGSASALLWPRGPLWLVLSLACLATLCLIRVAAAILRLRRLQAQWAAWKSSAANEPPIPLNEPIPISWWDLRRAGFEPVPYGSLVDHNLNLTGHPWRVLRRGRQRIPVIRSRTRDPALPLKDQVRLAGYRHLLEACDGGECPYGIVLFAGGHEGVAVPLDAERDRLLNTLHLCRALLRGEHAAELPPASHCQGCPWGYPRALPPGRAIDWRNGHPFAVYPVSDQEGELYHSTCGDRFRWIPPHTLCELLELEAE